MHAKQIIVCKTTTGWATTSLLKPEKLIVTYFWLNQKLVNEHILFFFAWWTEARVITRQRALCTPWYPWTRLICYEEKKKHHLTCSIICMSSCCFTPCADNVCQLGLNKYSRSSSFGWIPFLSASKMLLLPSSIKQLHQLAGSWFFSPSHFATNCIVRTDFWSKAA